MLERIHGDNIKGRVRLVKGSHIVVPKVHSQRHALILQNPDKRVVFVDNINARRILYGNPMIVILSKKPTRKSARNSLDDKVFRSKKTAPLPISLLLDDQFILLFFDTGFHSMLIHKFIQVRLL